MTENTNKNFRKIKRKRNANWETREKDLLKKFIRKFASIIENKKTDTETNKTKAIVWQNISQRFNKLNYRVRTLTEIRQQWRTIKLDAKKNMTKATKMELSSDKPKSTITNISVIEHENSQDLESDYVCDDNDADEKNPTTLPSDQKRTGIQCKISFNDKNRRRFWDKVSKERNQVILNCLQEEHDLKMKNIAETHKFVLIEHILKMQHMNEVRDLLNEEYQLNIEKLKLEMLMSERTNK